MTQMSCRFFNVRNMKDLFDSFQLHLQQSYCTYLTHSYLLNREDQPECVGCACPLTVQHMIDCVECYDPLYDPFFFFWCLCAVKL